MKKIDLGLNFHAIVDRIEGLMPRSSKGKASHKAWAERVGVTPQIVSNIHSKTKGKRMVPSMEYIMAVAFAHPDVDIRWLLTGDGQDPQLSEDASLAKFINILELIAGALRHDRRTRSVTALEGIVASWARALINSGLEREEVKRLLQRTTRKEEERVKPLAKKAVADGKE